MTTLNIILGFLAFIVLLVIVVAVNVIPEWKLLDRKQEYLDNLASEINRISKTYGITNREAEDIAYINYWYRYSDLCYVRSKGSFVNIKNGYLCQNSLSEWDTKPDIYVFLYDDNGQMIKYEHLNIILKEREVLNDANH